MYNQFPRHGKGVFERRNGVQITFLSLYAYDIGALRAKAQRSRISARGITETVPRRRRVAAGSSTQSNLRDDVVPPSVFDRSPLKPEFRVASCLPAEVLAGMSWIAFGLIPGFIGSKTVVEPGVTSGIRFRQRTFEYLREVHLSGL
jgi:hypothetical protein